MDKLEASAADPIRLELQAPSSQWSQSAAPRLTSPRASGGGACGFRMAPADAAQTVLLQLSRCMLRETVEGLNRTTRSRANIDIVPLYSAPRSHNFLVRTFPSLHLAIQYVRAMERAHMVDDCSEDVTTYCPEESSGIVAARRAKPRYGIGAVLQGVQGRRRGDGGLVPGTRIKGSATIHIVRRDQP